MQWLIPVTMGLWAVWTWSQEREQERLTKRARLAALYVNPFMSACEDLQSRIYNILERRGLRKLRERYPDGSLCRGDSLSHRSVFRMGSGSVTLQPLLSGPCRDSPCGSRAGRIRYHQRRLPGGAIQLLPP
jgi:hypothetical protein